MTGIAHHSLDSAAAHQDKKTHWVICTNSAIRNALGFQEIWVPPSVSLGRGFVLPVRTQIWFLALAPCSWKDGLGSFTQASWQQSSKT